MSRVVTAAVYEDAKLEVTAFDDGRVRIAITSPIRLEAVLEAKDAKMLRDFLNVEIPNG